MMSNINRVSISYITLHDIPSRFYTSLFFANMVKFGRSVLDFLWIRPYGQVRHHGVNIFYCVRLSVIGVHECKVLLFLPCLRLVMDKTFFRVQARKRQL